jgi:hypothetical protein
MAHASYLHVLDMGEIGACQTPTRMPTGVGDSCYFPKATAMAMEAGGSIGYRMSSAFELRAGIDIRRYGLSFHQSYADFTASGYNSKVAGGAVDQYLMIWLGATVLLDAGSGGGGDEDEEESPKKSKKKAKPKKTEEEEEPKASTSIEE